MKKINILLTGITVMIGLTACNPQKDVKDGETEKTRVTHPKTVNEQKKEEVKQNAVQNKNTQDSKTTKQPTTDESISNAPKEKVYQNAAFRNVVVKETNDKIVITGKAQVFEGVFRYALSDGNHVIFNNRYQTVGAPAWGDFKISFNKSLITADQTIFELFVYSAKDGTKENVLEIPLPAK